MRESKFRVWDNQIKSYEWDREFVVSKTGELMELHSNNDGTWEYRFADTDRFIIELSTGLEDKNGKEIYEGDIVKCVHGNVPIVFRNCRCWLGETLDDLYVANLLFDIEVIGNIHKLNKEEE